MKLHKYLYLNKTPPLLNRMTRPSGLHFLKMGTGCTPHPVYNFKKKIQTG